ncbi:MAG: NarL/FixJ family [Chloroflexi bacterium]|jgi:pilus assembly protein CpaE|nr:MAG: NarL/FixJ family [Chloroflexota bacterium]
MTTIQRAMLVDSSPDSRARMQHLLTKAPLFIVAESGYGQRATALAVAKRPAVALVSVEAPLERALNTLNTLRAELPEAMLIAYTSHRSAAVVKEAMRAGADGVLAAPVDGTELLAMLAGRELRLTDPDLTPELTSTVDHATDVAPATPRGKIFTVYHVKGGVGASTIAANLAAAIATQTGSRVLAMDLDSRFGDLATLMDLEPEFSLADLADVGRTADLDREILARATTTHESGVDFLCAARRPADWRPISAQQLRVVIEFAARMYDYVILDAPSALDDMTATAIELADRTLLVSSFDRTSVYAAARVAEMLGHSPASAAGVRLVLNQVQEERVIDDARARESVGLEIYASIPFDPAVIEASQSGTPVVTNTGRSSAALALHALAGDLAGYVPQAESAPAWDRVIGWASGREPVKTQRRRALI